MSKVLIIAEAGVNHNGDFELAKKLVDEAALAGADYVKFQFFKADELVSANAQKAEYQKQTTSAEESQFDMLKKLEMDEKSHQELKTYAENKGIGFLSSPFGVSGVDFLDSLNIDLFKIPSGEITNRPLLEKVASCNKPVILSTGMSTLDEIQAALDLFRNNSVTLLHCNSEYPTPMCDVNLKAMLTLKEKFQVEVGFSDHTLGIEIPIAAATLGATVIEKHFTLDTNMDGPDHRASLNPSELKKMVSAIRNIGQALGDGVKKPTPSELKNRDVARKSIVALKDIKEGEVFTLENISVKRPAGGMSPMEWHKVLGQKSKFNFVENEMIKL